MTSWAEGAPCLDQKALAWRWGVSVRTLEGWRLRRKGPPYLKLGRRVVYPLEGILEFEQAQLRPMRTD
jgi:hypothetical protein